MKEEKVTLKQAVTKLAKLCLKENKNPDGDTAALGVFVSRVLGSDCSKFTEEELVQAMIDVCL